MLIEVWSDVVCSWCYIGKRHLERAMEALPEDERPTVRYRSFELDPTIAADAGLADEELARRRGITLEQAREMHAQTERQGAEVGISFDFRRARRGNTFDAHRVLQMAHDHGCQPAVKERLLATYFSEGGAIGDRATLADGRCPGRPRPRPGGTDAGRRSLRGARCAPTSTRPRSWASTPCRSSSSTAATGWPAHSRPNCCAKRSTRPGRSAANRAR